MLVPGVHLINGLFDLIDNHLPMSLARLGLAAGIVLASALGIVVGVELTLPNGLPAEQATNTERLNVFTDMLLAGIVTCGFAISYNTPWRQIGMAAVGGMVGHGLRFLALEAGERLEAATFLGSLAVGVISTWIARTGKTPIAVIAFAGAVTMMPGLHIYRALAGALDLARQGARADAVVVAATLGSAFQACLVVSGLVLGLLVGVRTVLALAGTRAPSPPPSAPSNPEQAGPPGSDETCLSGAIREPPD